MKMTKKWATLVIGASGCIGVALLAACGGGDSGGPQGLPFPSVGTPKTISTAAQAQKAVGSVDMATTLVADAIGFGGIDLAKATAKVTVKRVAADIPNFSASANNGTHDLSSQMCTGGKYIRVVNLRVDGQGTIVDRVTDCGEPATFNGENAMEYSSGTSTYDVKSQNNWTVSTDGKSIIKVGDALKKEYSIKANAHVEISALSNDLAKLSATYVSVEKNIPLNSTRTESVSNFSIDRQADGRTYVINSGAVAKEVRKNGAQTAYIGVAFKPGFKVTDGTDFNGQFAIAVQPASACAVDGTYDVITTANGDRIINTNANVSAAGNITVGTDTATYNKAADFVNQCTIFQKIDESID